MPTNAPDPTSAPALPRDPIDWRNLRTALRIGAWYLAPWIIVLTFAIVGDILNLDSIYPFIAAAVAATGEILAAGNFWQRRVYGGMEVAVQASGARYAELQQEVARNTQALAALQDQFGAALIQAGWAGYSACLDDIRASHGEGDKVISMPAARRPGA